MTSDGTALQHNAFVHESQGAPTAARIRSSVLPDLRSIPSGSGPEQVRERLAPELTHVLYRSDPRVIGTERSAAL